MTLLIALIIGLAVGIIIFITDDDCSLEFVLFTALFFVFVPGCITTCSLTEDRVIDKHIIYLENLSDNIGVSGEFFLGSGTINSEWQYTYYEKINNSYYLKHIPAKNVPIIYTTGEPRIEYYISNRTDTTINLFAINMNGTTLPHGYKIYIPKGSIKNNFTLDAN